MDIKDITPQNKLLLTEAIEKIEKISGYKRNEDDFIYYLIDYILKLRILLKNHNITVNHPS